MFYQLKCIILFIVLCIVLKSYLKNCIYLHYFNRPSQLYLVLDVTNLTTSEMALEYSAGKRMLLSGGEACRVPVPLKRCPLNMPIPLNQG